jgi:hypothetical protein
MPILVILTDTTTMNSYFSYVNDGILLVNESLLISKTPENEDSRVSIFDNMGLKRQFKSTQHLVLTWHQQL